MYMLYSKLKAVKKILKAKNLEVFGGWEQKVMKARQDLASAQVFGFSPSCFSCLSWGCGLPCKRARMFTRFGFHF